MGSLQLSFALLGPNLQLRHWLQPEVSMGKLWFFKLIVMAHLRKNFSMKLKSLLC